MEILLKKYGKERTMREEVRYLSQYISKDIFKVLKVNLTQDTYEVLLPETDEKKESFSGFLREYIEEGGAHYDDRRMFANNLDMDYLRKFFETPDAKWSIRYRRKAKDEYRWTIIRMFEYKKDKSKDKVLLLYARDDNTKDQRGLNPELKAQYTYLSALSDIYYSMHIINPKTNSIYEVNPSDVVSPIITTNDHAKEQLLAFAKSAVIPSCIDAASAFMDLNTLQKRMGKRRMISEEFINKTLGWIRVQFIVVSYDETGDIDKVISTLQVIEEEKKREEMLRKLSTTDELTHIFNRRAYEEDMTEYKLKNVKDNFCYFSVDLNGLKEVNDTRGHEAGDEIIIAAAQCLTQTLGKLGKVYRVGGDEFAVMLCIEREKLEQLINELMLCIAQWRGVFSKEFTLSMGYAFWDDHRDMSLKELANLADNMMYRDKANYYARTGRNRRQR